MYLKTMLAITLIGFPAAAAADDESGSFKQRYEYLTTTNGDEATILTYSPIISSGETIYVDRNRVGSYFISGGVDGKDMEVTIRISNRTDCEMVFNGTFYSNDDLTDIGEKGSPFKLVSWMDGHILEPNSSLTISDEWSLGSIKSRKIGFVPNGRVNCE